MQLVTQLENRKKTLEVARSTVVKSLKKRPSGTLDVRKQGSKYYYYLNEYVGSTRKKVYLPHAKLPVATAIAQCDYMEGLLDCINEELAALTNYLAVLETQNPESHYASLHPARQHLVTPLIHSDESYARAWLAERSPKKNSYEITSNIYTENNEHVRSKTEKIIADKLLMEGVPYKYEEALKIGTYTVYPDFTVLKKSTREYLLGALRRHR